VTQPLGRTGPVLSGFGLGLAALGRPAYITVGHAGDLPQGRSVEAMEAHAHRVLDHAFARGVRYFDAARSYGRAEVFLRSWVDSRGIRPGEIAIGSKWGYRYTGEWQVDGRVQEVKDHGVSMLSAQSAESMSILGPYLNLYQIHSAAAETRVLENEQVIGQLLRLRERGLFLGVTVTGTTQLETLRRAVDLRFDGAPLFSAVQATWNLMERSAEPGLREAHDAGLAVLVKEPLANGRLTPRGDAGKAGPLRAVADRLGASADAVALAFVAKEPWADVVLLGAATEEQVESNLRAREVKLDAEDLRLLDGMLVSAQEYWSHRARMAWN
jgi:aryl-alcohol dehydrogenase-like predicted oxidoreductase